MNNKNKVDKIIMLPLYLKGLKQLKKKHKKTVITKLKQIVNELAEFSITTEYDNHMLKNSNGKMELHVDPDVLLVYRYDGDILYVELKLLALTSHDDLDVTLKNLKKE